MRELTSGIPEDKIGIMLSSGVDSTCLSAAAHAVGIKAHAFTMRIVDNQAIGGRIEAARDVIHDLAFTHPELASHPDYMVGYLYDKVF